MNTPLNIEPLEERNLLSTSTFELPLGDSGNDVVLEKDKGFINLVDATDDTVLARFKSSEVDRIRIVGQNQDRESLTINYGKGAFFQDVFFDGNNGADHLQLDGGSLSSKLLFNGSNQFTYSGNETKIRFESVERVSARNFDGKVQLRTKADGDNAMLHMRTETIGDAKAIGGTLPNQLRFAFEAISRMEFFAPDLDLISQQLDAEIGRLKFFGLNSADIQMKDFTESLMPVFHGYANSPMEYLRIRSDADLTITGADLGEFNRLKVIAETGEFLCARALEKLTIFDSDEGHTIDGERSPVPLLLRGNGGHDTLIGSMFDDVMFGGRNNDAMYGNDGNDRLTGNENMDHIYGGEGDDILDANSGCDRAVGGPGRNRISGGEGKDILISNNGMDFVDGGEGEDQLKLEGSSEQEEFRFAQTQLGDLMLITKQNGEITNRRILTPDEADMIMVYGVEGDQGPEFFDVDPTVDIPVFVLADVNFYRKIGAPILVPPQR